ncbi:class I SAM-dependent RNA methyltransferase, partial [Myxococcota bacterium]|nr:class I SAM-dependent RNA methyltransferase [Myxococcota bacterium]
MDQPFLYQDTSRYFAQVVGESEEAAAQELNDMGMERVEPTHRGVWFDASFQDMMRANYSSRTVSR